MIRIQRTEGLNSSAIYITPSTDPMTISDKGIVTAHGSENVLITSPKKLYPLKMVLSYRFCTTCLPRKSPSRRGSWSVDVRWLIFYPIFHGINIIDISKSTINHRMHRINLRRSSKSVCNFFCSPVISWLASPRCLGLSHL